MPPAAPSQVTVFRVLSGKALHECGGQVLEDSMPHAMTHMRCTLCGHVWKNESLLKWDLPRLSAVFHMPPMAIDGNYRLVEEQEGKRRYTKLVSA